VSLVNLGFRIAYRIAYQLMRLHWRILRPNTHGALVAIWHDGEILLVKNSYVSFYSLPGGYLKRGETAIAAAIRELVEECSIRVKPDELRPGRTETHPFEGKSDTVEIFDLDVAVRPPITVDNREVVSAAFFKPEDALRLKLFPPLHRHIEERVRMQRPG
jgi:8-oxo-dGTP diphosphatase